MTAEILILQVKNWKQFQHYKDRNPPWIKLHFNLLSSKDWVVLDDASRVLAVACMLLASRSDLPNGQFEADPEYFKRVAYLNTEPDFKPLIKCGFLCVASECKQVLANDNKCDTETETETYKEEEEKEAPRKKSVAPTIEIPDWINPTLWLDFETHRKEIKAKLTPTATKHLLTNLEKHMNLGVDPNEAIRQSIENQWRGVFPERLLEYKNGSYGNNGATHSGRNQAVPDSAVARGRRASERVRAQIAAEERNDALMGAHD